jgi:NCS1 family nucleobase:cation symporter-1
MILMFVVGALAAYPTLRAAMGGDAGFFDVADQFIWKGDKAELTMWHVAAFAWVCNLAMHGGMSDMTVLRFAKKYQYGFFSALGMFIGHYLAWVCAGIMGAGAALLLQQPITALDAGAVAFEVLGAAGILAVIIAGWTTSNPTIYRAGLAFQSLNPRWSRGWVTALTGAVTTVIACFPFVFTKLMDFVGLMGLLLVPMGAVIVTEHWLFPRLGLTRYWSHYKGETTNKAAVISWLVALVSAWVLSWLGVHLFFLLVPVWVITTVVYTVLACSWGAKRDYPQAQKLEAEHRRRRAEERAWLDSAAERSAGRVAAGRMGLLNATLVVAIGSLLACVALALWVFDGGDFDRFKQWLWLPTLMYFAAAIVWVSVRNGETDGA